MTTRHLSAAVLCTGLLAGAFSLASAAARAQVGDGGNSSGGIPLGANLIQPDKVKTEEEKQRDAERDAAYRAAMKKIPAQAQPSNDPWGGVREPAKPAASAKKQTGANAK